ncbi:hypothetical protein D3C73_382060 [compost metagenome]
MKKRVILVFIAACCLLAGAACSNKEEQKILVPTTLSKEYPGDILKVDQITLQDGSTGAKVIVDRQDEIRSFLDSIKDDVLQPDPNQEGRTGFVYRMMLYEKGILKLDIIPNSIGKVYYLQNEDLRRDLSAFFEKKFKK